MWVIARVCMCSCRRVLPSEGFFYLEISEQFLSGVSQLFGGRGETGAPSPDVGRSSEEQLGWLQAAAPKNARCRAKKQGQSPSPVSPGAGGPAGGRTASRDTGSAPVRTQARQSPVPVVEVPGNPQAKQVVLVKVQRAPAAPVDHASTIHPESRVHSLWSRDLL